MQDTYKVSFDMESITENDTKKLERFFSRACLPYNYVILSTVTPQKIRLVASDFKYKVADFKTRLRTAIKVDFSALDNPEQVIDAIAQNKKFRMWIDGENDFVDFTFPALGGLVHNAALGYSGHTIYNWNNWSLHFDYMKAEYNDMSFPIREDQYVSLDLDEKDESNQGHKLDPNCSHLPINIGVLSEKWVCKRCDGDLTQKELDIFFKKK